LAFSAGTTSIRQDNVRLLADDVSPMTGLPDGLDAKTQDIVAQITRIFSRKLKNPSFTLFSLLRGLAKWRAEVLKPMALEATGGLVASGPFTGMKFTRGAAEGCFLPKLLGCYELELHPHLMALRKERRYETIIDLGSAEGYYAVGLARLFPEARVLARDTDARSLPLLQAHIALNAVEGRVEPGGLFGHGDFAVHAGRKVLVFCDIEGGEGELLDPAKAPALAGFDLVVEAHEGMDATLPAMLARRFDRTHDIIGVRDQPRVVSFPARYQPRDSIDRLISMWEFRSSPTPWLIMRAKNFPK
jgi:hypothetical protein